MFIVLQIGVNTGMATFNVPPSAAFLISIDLQPKPLALIVHFGYAAIGSIILVAIFGRRTNLSRGIGLGFFGAGGPSHQLPPDNPLYLGSAGKFVILTLLLHAVYGIIVGWLDRVWIDWSEEERQVME